MDNRLGEPVGGWSDCVGGGWGVRTRPTLLGYPTSESWSAC